MFDDLDTAEQKTEEEQKPSEGDDKPIRGLSRWSHVIAIIVFSLLYFPFKSHPWSLYVAVAGAYSTFAFAIALGLALENLDDIFGDPRIPRYVATLFVPHLPVLGLIILATYLWLYLNGILPTWRRSGDAGLRCGAFAESLRFGSQALEKAYGWQARLSAVSKRPKIKPSSCCVHAAPPTHARPHGNPTKSSSLS
jgi:hypothetical protein